MLFWWFGNRSSGVIFSARWVWFGPWYVRFVNGDPVSAYHLDDIKGWASSTKKTDDQSDGWRYGA